MWKKYLVLTIALCFSVASLADISLVEDEDEEIVARTSLSK